jgi:hypothetical protein
MAKRKEKALPDVAAPEMPPTDPPKREATSLGYKLAKVLGEIKSIEKTGHNPHYHYDYITEDVLTDQIRPLLAKHGIALMFGAVSCDDLPPNRTRVWCEFILMDCDGNEKRVLCPGEGKDEKHMDKALAKAMTMATKYWLYKTFLVSTGMDEPEKDDKPSNEDRRPPPASKSQAPPEADLMTAKQRESLEKILQEKANDVHLKYSTQLIDLVKKSLTTDGPVTEGSAKRLIAEAKKQKQASKKVNGEDESAKQTPAAEAEKKDEELEF